LIGKSRWPDFHYKEPGLQIMKEKNNYYNKIYKDRRICLAPAPLPPDHNLKLDPPDSYYN